jgi:hemin uptake protein HemP
MDTLHKQPGQPARSNAPATPHRVSSADILRGANLVEIDHAGQRYLLRVTRENKLILTK